MAGRSQKTRGAGVIKINTVGKLAILQLTPVVFENTMSTERSWTRGFLPGCFCQSDSVKKCLLVKILQGSMMKASAKSQRACESYVWSAALINGKHERLTERLIDAVDNRFWSDPPPLSRTRWRFRGLGTFRYRKMKVNPPEFLTSCPQTTASVLKLRECKWLSCSQVPLR